LAVAVSQTIAGTSRPFTGSRHVDEIQGAVQAALEVGNINIKGELIANQIEHLVPVCALHEIDATSDVGAVLMLGHKPDIALIAAGSNSVGA
jgi:hypothetical protein